MSKLVDWKIKILCLPYFSKNKRRQVRDKLRQKFGVLPTAAAQIFINSVTQKIKGLQQRTKQTKILVIGDSHAQFGVLPFALGGGTCGYNFAFTSNSLYEDLQTLKYAHKICPNLEQVVLVVSFYNCGFNLAMGAEAWRRDIVAKCLGVNFTENNNPHADAEIWSRAIDELKPDANFYCVQGYDFAGNHQTAFPQKKIEERVGGHYKLFKKYKNQLPYLEKICDYCEQNKLKLLLVNTPVRRDYQECLDNMKDKDEDLLSGIKNIAQTKGVKFLNPVGFEVDDFADADHLSFEGALKLTRQINETLC